MRIYVRSYLLYFLHKKYAASACPRLCSPHSPSRRRSLSTYRMVFCNCTIRVQCYDTHLLKLNAMFL